MLCFDIKMSDLNGEKMTPGDRCGFFVLRKKRCCRMLVKPGKKYCGEHAHLEQEQLPSQGRIKERFPGVDFNLYIFSVQTLRRQNLVFLVLMIPSIAAMPVDLKITYSSVRADQNLFLCMCLPASTAPLTRHKVPFRFVM